MPAAKASEKQARPEGVSVTIKTGKGFEDTWLGFTGSVQEVRENIKATFELDDTDLTLFELVQNATQTAHGVTTAVRGLGGRVEPTSSAPAAPTADEAQQTNAFDQAARELREPEKEQDPYDALDAAVQEFTDLDALREFYAEPANKALFTAGTERAEASKKAWQKKGRQLNKKT